MKKKALLIGGNRQAKFVADSLLKQGYRITVVNESMEICQSFADNSRLSIINGDGSMPNVLDDAGAHDADLAVVITARDDDNIVICEICKKLFNVKKTLSLISDPQKIDISNRMGIDFIVCPLKSISNIIEKQIGGVKS